MLTLLGLGEEMSFADFMTDNIVLKKKNGGEFLNLKAQVSKKGIFLDRGDVLIESGDVIERRMSNGGTEVFEVIDPGFHEAWEGMEAHYQMSVRKLGLSETQKKHQNVVYNVTGHNARINTNSTDNSVNVVSESSELLLAHVEELRAAARQISDSTKRGEALDLVDAVEAQLVLPNPKRAIVSSLLNGLSSLANIATVAQAIMLAIPK